VLKVATIGLDASSWSGVPLLDRLVNNTLVKFIPYGLDTLAQLISIVDLHLVHLFMIVSNAKIVQYTIFR